VEPKRYFTPRELARITGVSAVKIRRAIRGGELRAATFGSKTWRRVSLLDFEEWRERTTFVPPVSPTDARAAELADAALRREATLGRG
jgi:excisionase family DNA binding protein